LTAERSSSETTSTASRQSVSKTGGLVVGIVVQARMGSTRLPGKILEPIAGKPMLGHILGRLATLSNSASVIVATGETSRDDVVAAFCSQQGTHCFRGSEQDVLGRYYECARSYGLNHVVRATGDNPFIDTVELDRLIDLQVGSSYDYCSSKAALPIGVGTEIFSFDALERSFRQGTAAHHREHIDEYILENPSLFRTCRLIVPRAKWRPDVRLTVDTPEDLRRARFVAEHAGDRWVTTEEAIDLCSRFA